MNEIVDKIVDAAEPFVLDHTDPKGLPPDRVIGELRHAYRVAKDHAQSYIECIDAQAEKFSLKKGALKRYINALENDKVSDTQEEIDDLERLLER